MIAPADASMIFSGGKTCRKLRALLPNMKDDRSSLSAGASSREWCVRQTTKKIRDVFVDETRPERRERDAPAPSARVESPAPNPAPRPRLVSEGPSGENRRSPARCAARSPRLRVPPSRAFCLLRARQLGGQLARPRPPDRAHAPSTVRRHLYNSVRLDRRWGPLGVVPIKLAVFLPAAVLDLGGLLSNRSGTTPMEASVAAVAMSALVAIMAVFIFFPNAASHYLRRTRKDGGCVSWLVHPFVGEVTLWACVLATEIGSAGSPPRR